MTIGIYTKEELDRMEANEYAPDRATLKDVVKAVAISVNGADLDFDFDVDPGYASVFDAVFTGVIVTNDFEQLEFSIKARGFLEKLSSGELFVGFPHDSRGQGYVGSSDHRDFYDAYLDEDCIAKDGATFSALLDEFFNCDSSEVLDLSTGEKITVGAILKKLERDIYEILEKARAAAEEHR